MAKRWGMLAIGLGLGLLAGMLYGEVLLIPALVAVTGGAVLVAARGRAPAQVLGQVPAQVPAQRDRPTLAGLGTRVDQVLRLAEDQAKDHLREAERQAAEIIAEARADAARIRAGD